MSRRSRLTLSAGCALLAAGVAACSAGGPAPMPPNPPSSTSARSPCGVTRTAPAYHHVVWLLMENHGARQLVGNPAAPYLNSLIAECGLATNYHAITHPSLPNYIAMTSGSTQDITSDGPPAEFPLTADSIFQQLGGGRWRALAQSMPANCYPRDSGAYVPRHNPATYYVNVAQQCARQSVPLTQPPDVSAPFTFIAPDQNSNTHDTTVAVGDAFLAGFVPQILASPQYRAGDTVLVITYDEDEGEQGSDNTVATVVVAPSTPSGTRDGTAYSHYSLLRTTEELLGLGYLGNAATATSMSAGFNL